MRRHVATEDQPHVGAQEAVCTELLTVNTQHGAARTTSDEGLGHVRWASAITPRFGGTPGQQGSSTQQGRRCLGIAMLAGMGIALMLAGCAKRLSGVHAPGSTVEQAGQMRLAWESPTTKADGTPLTDLAGYKLYYGLTSRTYDFLKTVGNQTTYALSDLEPGRTYYFAVTVYDASGNESPFSNEVHVTVPRTASPIPMLTQDPLTRGRAAQFRVMGAHAHEIVSFLFSLAGEGDGPCSQQLGGLCVNLLSPSVFGEATADASGTAMLTCPIPADTPAGRTIAFQAVIRRGPGGANSVKTNTITAIMRESR
jgi:Fibronectin type III domain